MEIVLAAFSGLSMVAAIASAYVAHGQRRDARAAAEEARQSADEARDDRAKAVEAAQRIASAQERVAEVESDRQHLAAQEQANEVRLRVSTQAGGRGRVRIQNNSDQPIFDAQIHSIMTRSEDGTEIPVRWRPNPDMTPVVRVRDRIDGQTSGEIYPSFDGDPPDPWAIIVTFRDAQRRQWQINLQNDVEPFDD